MRDEPFFNLKAVVRQTGLKPDTLRAWERRYGLPAPERSAGGHRLYSQRDIETIRWLMARQDEGLSISRAVDLWQQIVGEGRDPLRSMPSLAVPPAPAPVPHPAGETIVELRQAVRSACLAYDEREADQILAQAFALYSPETVVLDLLQKVVAEVGEDWYRDRATVQQEHFCSNLVMRRLETLIAGAPLPTRPGRILAACAPDEDHAIGLLLLTFLLRRRGWDVLYLGANVPVERLSTTVATTHPQLVILSAQLLHTAATLLEMAEDLQAAGVPLAYGGLIFNLLPELRSRIPGHFLGERLDVVPQVVEGLMIAPRPVAATHPVPAEIRRARDHFEGRKALVEAQLLRSMGDLDVAPRHLVLASQELALNIGAALALGDVAYLGTDVHWVEGLLRNRGLPLLPLYDYLEAYRRAAEQYLDGRGAPVVDWLSSMLRQAPRH